MVTEVGVCIYKSMLIKLQNRLSPENTIAFAGSDFYRIGLSLFKPYNTKRNVFYHPLLVCSIVASYTLRWVISIIIMEKNVRDVAIHSGDWLFFLPKEIRLHLGIAVFVYFCNGLVFPLIHFKYSWKGMAPTYLRPFYMMSGALTPESIGFTNVMDVKKLLKRTKISIKLADLVAKSGIPAGLIVAGVPFYLNMITLFELIYVIPGIIFFIVAVNYTAHILTFQISYFHIICFYLKLKIRRINSDLKLKAKRIQIIRNLRSIVSVHKEIIEYNNNFWSEYLMAIMSMIMPTLNLLIFTTFFGDFKVIYKCLFIYITSLFLLFLLFISLSASSVATQSNKTYETLYNYYTNNKKFDD